MERHRRWQTKDLEADAGALECDGKPGLQKIKINGAFRRAKRKECVKMAPSRLHPGEQPAGPRRESSQMPALQTRAAGTGGQASPHRVRPLTLLSAGPGPGESLSTHPAQGAPARGSCCWFSKLDVLGAHPSGVGLKSWGCPIWVSNLSLFKEQLRV